MDAICSESMGARRYEIPSLQATMYYYLPLSVLAAVLCDVSTGFLRSEYIIFVFFVVSTLFKETTVTAGKKNRLPAEKQLPHLKRRLQRQRNNRK